MSVDWTDEATAAAALRARGVESDLEDPALHAYALAAVGEIAARGYGPSTVDVLVDGRGQRLIALNPPAASVSSVTADGMELAEDDDGYRLRPGGHYLERLAEGSASAWWGTVAIEYASAAADERYDRVVTDLVKLGLQFSGLDSRRDGDYAEEALGARGGGLNSYQQQRDLIIAELAAGWSFA